MTILNGLPDGETQTGATMRHRFEVFQGLEEEQFNKLREHLERVDFEPGEVIIREGEEGDRLFLIDEGMVEIFHQEHEDLTINKLSEGETFGVMALFEQQKRFASVRAGTKCTLFSLSQEGLKKVPECDYHRIVNVLIKNQLLDQIRVLQAANKNTVKSLLEKLEFTETRLKMGTFVAFVIGLMASYSYLLRICIDYIAKTRDSTPASIFLIIFIATLTFIGVKKVGYPLSSCGLNLNKWREGLKESLLWTLAFIIVTTLLKWVLISTVSEFQGSPLFSWRGFVKFGFGGSILLMTAYALFVPFQEFICRGALQGYLQRFLTGNYVKTKAVFLATLVFGSNHLHLSTSYALVAIFPGLLWGALYARQGSLLGVSVSHILVGIYAAFMLGVPGLSY